MTKNYYYFIILLLIAIGVSVFSCANPNNGVTSKPVPIITNHTPMDGMINVSIDTSIILDFNVLVTAGTGSIILSAQGEDEITISVTNINQVTIGSRQAIISPSDSLAYNKTYIVTIPEGVFQNTGNIPTANPTIFSFTTTTGVLIHSLILENTNANPQTAINLAELEVYTNHFRQGVNFATNADNTINSGMIGNFGGPANSAARLIDGNRANVASTDIYHSDGTYATENWVKLFFAHPIFLDTNNNDTSLLEVVVYNRENQNSLQDRATNLTVHLYDASDTQIATFGIGLSLIEAQNDILSFPFDLLFDTNTIPMIIGHTPTASATGVLISTPITLDFNIRVLPVASKNITLTPTSGSAIIIATTDPQVRIIRNTVTVDPTSALMVNKQYTVNIEAGAFKSAYDIESDATSFTFTTEPLVIPMVVNHTPIDSATDVLANANIILTFNTPITAVSGNNITLTPTASSSTTVTIAVDDNTQVNIMDRAVTINPTDNLDPGEYTFNIPAGAFKNSENMPTTTHTNFSFTTSIPFADFNLNYSANQNPQGITFANNKFWVVDFNDNKVYAYDNTRTRSSSDDFALGSANGRPTGIAFANSMFWVVDSQDDKVYAYTSTGTYSSANDFDLESGNRDPFGITFGNNMFWVVDSQDDKVFAYTSTGMRSSANDFDLASDNRTPEGITLENNKFWVANFTENKVYAYTSTGTYSSANDFDLESGNRELTGITFADNKFWVVDSSDKKVYVYDINGNRP